ncbi:enkurin-like isoform X2 [Daphnia pulex]|uniref:enkurin-like isoform X2 n=1 Tax=Daphnia pulex TaxID=6669 RepID=UPI001EDE6B80|nr:enkurin-like isoform X2 [Daphnia pulex]
MAGPGALKNTVREREFQTETSKSGRSIKRNHVTPAEREGYVGRRPRANRCSCQRLPPVPKRNDPVPAPYPPSHDNYIDYNAKHVDPIHCHEPKLQIVDSKDGHVMDLEKSGLVPHYTTKSTFGRVPNYLKFGQTQSQHGDSSKDVQSRSETTKERPKAATRVVNKDIEVRQMNSKLQQRWIELEKRLGLISFSRPDKREAIEDELRSIELNLRMAVSG